jgi:hypothetical protein
MISLKKASGCFAWARIHWWSGESDHCSVLWPRSRRKLTPVGQGRCKHYEYNSCRDPEWRFLSQQRWFTFHGRRPWSAAMLPELMGRYHDGLLSLSRHETRACPRLLAWSWCENQKPTKLRCCKSASTLSSCWTLQGVWCNFTTKLKQGSSVRPPSACDSRKPPGDVVPHHPAASG